MFVAMVAMPLPPWRERPAMSGSWERFMGFIRSIFGTGTAKVAANARESATSSKAGIVVGGTADMTGTRALPASDGRHRDATMGHVRRHVDMSRPHDDDLPDMPFRGRHGRRVTGAEGSEEKRAYADAISRLSVPRTSVTSGTGIRDDEVVTPETSDAIEPGTEDAREDVTLDAPAGTDVPVIGSVAGEVVTTVQPTVGTIEDGDMVEVAIADDGTVAAVEDIADGVESEASVPDEILPSDDASIVSAVDAHEDHDGNQDASIGDAERSSTLEEDHEVMDGRDDEGEGTDGGMMVTNGEPDDEGGAAAEDVSDGGNIRSAEDEDDGRDKAVDGEGDHSHATDSDAGIDGGTDGVIGGEVTELTARPSRTMLESMIPDIDAVTSASTVPEGYGDVVLADCVDCDDPSVSSDPFYAYSRAELDDALRSSCKARRKAIGKDGVTNKVESDGKTGVWLPKTVLAAMPAEVLRGIIKDRAVSNMSSKYGILEYARVRGARMEMRCPSPSALAEMLVAYPVIRTARKSVSDGAYPAIKEDGRKAVATTLGHAAKRIERAIVVMCDASVLDDLDDDLADAVEAYAVVDGKRAMESGMEVVRRLVG